MLDQLKAANGADFDRVFIDQQTNAHQKALAMLQNYVGNGNSQPLKDFAESCRGGDPGPSRAGEPHPQISVVRDDYARRGSDAARA